MEKKEEGILKRVFKKLIGSDQNKKSGLSKKIKCTFDS